MSLLTIGQNVAREVGVIQPTAITTATDPDVAKILRLCNKVGERLQKIFDWQVLTKERTFTSVATEEQTGIFTGITDFDRFVPETFWDRTAQDLISGPITAVEWQGLKATSYSNTEARKFRHRGGLVYITPTMAAGKTLAFEYISTDWCESSGAVGKSAFTADTDVGRISEELITRGVIWEFLVNESLPAEGAAHAYEEYFQALAENDRPGDDILVAGDIFGGSSQGRHFGGAPPVSGSGGLF